MSLVYKGLSVSCFNRQLQPQVTQHGPPGRVTFPSPLSPRPSSALGRDRCSGSPARWWRGGWGLRGGAGGLLPPGCGRSVSGIGRKPSARGNCGGMKRLPSAARPHEYLWPSTLCSRLEKRFGLPSKVVTAAAASPERTGGIL